MSDRGDVTERTGKVESPEVTAGVRWVSDRGDGTERTGKAKREEVDARGGTRVLLVRHGQSIWNADGRWQGQADPPLSRLGEEQARRAGSSASVADVVSVWTSDLVRARRTAELIALGKAASVEIRDEPRLRERHAGEWEGLTRSEIESGWPGFLATHRRPAGWEDDERVLERALAVLVAIEQQGRGAVLAVTHGGLIRAVERHLSAPELPVPNLGGRWISVDGGVPLLRERVLLVDVDEVTIPGQI